MVKAVLSRVLLSAILLFSGMMILSCNDKRERIYPQRMKITESVYSSVTIQPDSLYKAYASVGGILDRNLVEEGAVVSKGDPIAQIINSTPALNRENARLALELAEQNYKGNNAVLKSLREQIDAARIQFRNDSINYERQRKLWEQGIGSRAEFDRRELAFELSRNNLSLKERAFAQAQNELESLYRQARNNYESARITAGDFAIESKINGTVYALYKEPGEIVTTMEPVASVGSSEKFLVEMLVDEVDIVKILLNQKVLISLDAYPGQVFQAEVNKIYPKKDERSQTFKVEALFVTPPPILYPGLSGEGNIIIDQREDALVIPKEFISQDSVVETEGGPVIIRTGLQDLDKVEVLSGVDAGTALLKPEK